MARPASREKARYRSGMRRALVVGVMACATVLAESNAQACQWEMDCGAFKVPTSQALPMTAPALVIDTSNRSFSSTSLRATVTTAAGASVASALEGESGYSLVRFLEPLAAGASYRMHVENDCDASGSLETASYTIDFTAAAAQPLPTAAGAATVEFSTVSGLRIAKLVIVPSAELTPFLKVTRFRTTVDGQPWAHSEFGKGAGTPKPRRRFVAAYSRISTRNAMATSSVLASILPSARRSTPWRFSPTSPALRRSHPSRSTSTWRAPRAAPTGATQRRPRSHRRLRRP